MQVDKTGALSATPVLSCRSCGGQETKEFLALGVTPVANDLVGPDDAGVADPAYPLSVGFCETCALVQLTHELPAEAIFDEDYPYYSSFSDDLVRHANANTDLLVAERDLTSESFVVELASNDGYLLRNLLPHGVPVLGIEPTPGPAAAGRAAGVPTIKAFFGAEMGAQLRAERGPADVVIANNVMAHVPDLNSFVAGMAALVADDGIVQIENPSVQFLIRDVAFDTVYHEHFCYFSTIAVERLLGRYGLHLQHVEVFPALHGGSLRWTCGKANTRSAAVDGQLAEESVAGLGGFAAFDTFAERVQRTQAELLALLRRLRAEGASIAAYGAAAKGATLVNSTGIGTDLIDFVVDRNPHKQGKLMPGARIPIVDPGELITCRPDYVLLLAWNFRDEIVRQQQPYLEAGGRFIVPVPHAEIIG